MLNLVGSGKIQDSIMKDYFILWDAENIFVCTDCFFTL